MKRVKPGRGPSMMGAAGSIFAAVFGIFWTILALSMGAPWFFPLFGIMFIIIAVVQGLYHYKNATGKERFSVFDIVDDEEEGDPLDPPDHLNPLDPLDPPTRLDRSRDTASAGGEACDGAEGEAGDGDEGEAGDGDEGEAGDGDEGGFRSAARSDDTEVNFCPYCGAKAEKGFRFCQRCGKRIR